MHQPRRSPSSQNPLSRAAAAIFPAVSVFVALTCTNLAPATQAAALTGLARPALIGDALFAVKATPAAKMDLASINSSLLNSTVEVQGSIKSIVRPREGSRAPFRVHLTDDTGSINLIIWPDTYEVVEARFNLAAGDLIRVRARVTEFRGQIQLTLRDVEELQLLSKGSAAPRAEPGQPAAAPKALTAISSINESLMGQEIYIQATINNVREPRSERAPFIVTLTEGDAAIPMVFWSDLHARIAQHIRVGNVIRAKVTVGQHRGTLQVRLRDSRDLEVVSAGARPDSKAPSPEAAAPSAAAGEVVEIGRLTEEWVNQTVTISGKIASVEALGKGKRLRVEDSTGDVHVVLWENIVSGLAADGLQPGRSITLTGLVKVYRGQIEVLPSASDAVKLQP